MAEVLFEMHLFLSYQGIYQRPAPQTAGLRLTLNPMHWIVGTILTAPQVMRRESSTGR